MEQEKKLLLTLELVFWVVTAVITYGVLRPIITNLTGFPFLWHNVLAIVVTVTYTRYIFLWKYTFFSKSNIIRALIMIASIPLVFFLIQNTNSLQSYIDDYGYEAFMDLLKQPLSDERRLGLLEYIKSEFVFFSTGAVLAGVVLPIRMIISFWRTKNNEKV